MIYIMNAAEIVKSIHSSVPSLPEDKVQQLLIYKHNGKKGWNSSYDLNADLREEVVELLFEQYDNQYRDCIILLLRAEISFCRELTIMRETLRQLTFMLYTLKHIEDIPLLYEAKFDCSFDSSIGLDVELIFGYDMEKTKAYFVANPDENYDIVSTIEEYGYSGNRTPEQFLAAMHYYYNINP